MVATSLVAKSPSWIAKDDKYDSLCFPNRRMVACSPTVPTTAMKGIEVGARAGAKGEPMLMLKIAPGTKMAPKRLQYVIGQEQSSGYVAALDAIFAHNSPELAQSKLPEQWPTFREAISRFGNNR